MTSVNPAPPDPETPPPAPGSAEPVPWTEEDLERLRTRLGAHDTAFLARSLGRSVPEVLAKAEEIFDEPPRDGPWSSAQVEQLRGYVGLLDVPLIARMLGRTREAVDAKVLELARGLERAPLDAEQLTRFKRIYGTRADADLAVVFGRTLDVIEEAARAHCLSKDKAFLKRQPAEGAVPRRTRMPRWSRDELARLEELYPIASNLDIARELGRSVKSVVSKAHHLGLKKGKARLQQMGRQNVAIRYEREGEERGEGEGTAQGANG